MSMKPTIETLEWLSKFAPQTLLEWIQDGTLSNADMTFAVEYTGNCLQHEGMLDAVVALLDHESSLVRESALIALARLEQWPRAVVDKILIVACSDTSNAVRATADDIIGERAAIWTMRDD